MDFGSQIMEHHPALKLYARKLCSSVSDQNDLVQDTVMRALTKSHLHQPDTNLRSWLFTMMRNIRFDQYKKAKRTVVTEITDLMVPPRPAPQDDIALSKRLIQVLKSMTPDERRILVLVADGCTYEEIAQTLNINLGTVRSRLFRSRRQAEALLDGGLALLETTDE